MLATYYDFFSPQFLTATATVVLVVVTLAYVRETSNMVEVMRLDQKRPQIITLLSYGIEPILNDLERNAELLEKEGSAGTTPIVKLEQLELSEPVLRDIRNINPGLASDLAEYEELTTQYGEKWTNAQRLIADYIRENDELVESARGSSLTVNFLARQTLEVETTQEYKEERLEEWGNVRDKFINIRERPNFPVDISELQQMLARIRGFHNRSKKRVLPTESIKVLFGLGNKTGIEDELEYVKSEYLAEYDIVAVEIEKERMR